MVYDPRSLTPPVLSALYEHSRRVGVCMFVIEPHAPAFAFAHLRVRGLLDLVLGEGEGRKGMLLPFRGSGRSN